MWSRLRGIDANTISRSIMLTISSGSRGKRGCLAKQVRCICIKSDCPIFDPRSGRIKSSNKRPTKLTACDGWPLMMAPDDGPFPVDHGRAERHFWPLLRPAKPRLYYIQKKRKHQKSVNRVRSGKGTKQGKEKNTNATSTAHTLPRSQIPQLLPYPGASIPYLKLNIIYWSIIRPIQLHSYNK